MEAVRVTKGEEKRLTEKYKVRLEAAGTRLGTAVLKISANDEANGVLKDSIDRYLNGMIK